MFVYALYEGVGRSETPPLSQKQNRRRRPTALAKEWSHVLAAMFTPRGISPKIIGE